MRLLLCEYSRDHHHQEQIFLETKSEPVIMCSTVHQILYSPQPFFSYAFSLCKAKVQVVPCSLGLE